jgi:hypothetical protein
MLKKKYSRSTLESARLYAVSQGWKKLSKKRVQSFLEDVKFSTGYVNKASLRNYAVQTYNFIESENKRYKEATYRWAQVNKPDWENITDNRVEEFKQQLIDWADEFNIESINSDLALEFANLSLSPIDVEELDNTFLDDRSFIVTNMAGWSDSDAVDEFLQRPEFIEAKIIDIDQSIVYLGTDRRDFWDSFRSLSSGNRYPIYNAWQETDKFGNIFVTIKITGYYP